MLLFSNTAILRRTSLLLFSFLLLPLVGPAAGQSSSAPEALVVDSAETQRLADLSRLYGVVSFFHPQLPDQRAAWDSAFAAAARPVAQAPDSSAYADAVRALLGTLNDPATRLQAPPSSSGDGTVSVQWAADSVLVVRLRPASSQHRSAVQRALREARTRLPDAKGVVFDLRGPHSYSVARLFDYQSRLHTRLAPIPYTLPGVRTRVHEGFPSELESTDEDYKSYTRTQEATRLEPGAAPLDGPNAFLVDGGIPQTALALQRAGRAAIVQEGGDAYGAVPTHDVQLTDGITVQVRLGELLFPDGTRPGGAAVTVPASPGVSDRAYERALAFAQGAEPLPDPQSTPLTDTTVSTSPSYTQTSYPPVGKRLLAVARSWSIIDHFFPYKDLMDKPWQTALPDAVEGAVEAEDAKAFHLTVARMMAQTDDSHARASSNVLRRVFGRAATPALVRILEGKPVVTGLLDETVRDTTDLRPGDVVLSVDGTPVQARLDSLRRYLPTSTPQARRWRMARYLLRGPAGSTATLHVRGERGERTVELPRAIRRSWYSRNKDRPLMRRLTERIGYVDLAQLQPSQIDSVFARFGDTDALIFDMRGYPNGTAWPLAPHLTTKDRSVAARFSKPLRLGPGPRDRQTIDYKQHIAAPQDPHYSGRTVMLMDERTKSQAEHTGLFLKAANETTFVGSATNGTNGDVTGFVLPSGLFGIFTGQAVRHPDGRQLQRVGLQPDVKVRPTIESIRRGEDVVLQTAIDHLQDKLATRNGRD